MPPWETVRYSCDLGQEILAMASSDWEEGVVAILSDKDLCVIGKYLWDVPISTILPSQRQVRAMALQDSLVLIGTDFGLFYYNLTDQTQGEVSFPSDETLVPYGVTALDVGPGGICFGATHYIVISPHQVWYSRDGLEWTPMDFPEPLEVPFTGVWCGGSDQGLAVLEDGRWISLSMTFPSNPVTLGKITQVAFVPDGTSFIALVSGEEHVLFLGSSEGWRSLPSPCEQLISVAVGEIEGGSVPIVGCAEGIYYREVWEVEGIWQLVAPPE